jgi:hypothetical protein
MRKLFIVFTASVFFACSGNKIEETKEEPKEPAFCDCVNHDYHKDGDEEKCKKIEAELTEKLKNASVDEKGDILMKIQDCKVQGQYDND